MIYVLYFLFIVWFSTSIGWFGSALGGYRNRRDRLGRDHWLTKAALRDLKWSPLWFVLVLKEWSK